jgi:hypothetical protein
LHLDASFGRIKGELAAFDGGNVYALTNPVEVGCDGSTIDQKDLQELLSP